ncbi:MAG: nucleotidyltransferase family protein [Acidobacteriota bacterium]|jgi:predicted nucleotidyltransferase
MQPPIRLQIDTQLIIEFCRRRKITEFAIFGSVLREDFLPESDIDVLITFDPSAQWSLFDLVDMKDELEQLFGRKVDLVEKRALRNPFRKREILRTMQVMYAA